MDARELSRATLARQLLLERARLTVPRAVHRIGGVQAQDLAAPYHAFASRLETFRPAALDRALDARSVVKATLMRGTLHLVASADYHAFATALLPALQRQYATARLRGVPTEEIDELTARATAFAREPRTNRELRELLGGEDEWFRARFHGPFVFAPPLRKRLVVAADAWLGDAFPPREEALAYLVRRYLAAFGPATARDAARWARLPVGAVRAALERLRTIDLGDGLVDLPHAPRPGVVPAPVRLLPAFESILLAYDDRSRFLTSAGWEGVMHGGLIQPALLVDGVVAGRWQLERGRVIVTPLAPLPVRARRAVADETRRLEAVLAT
jgi:hypothetical protein